MGTFVRKLSLKLPNVSRATLPCTNPHQSQINAGNSRKNASFQRVALSPQNWPVLAQLGPPQRQLRCPSWSQWVRRGWGWVQMYPKLKPCDAHEGPSHVQSGATWDLWRQLHAKLGPTETQHGERCSTRRSVIDADKTWEISVKGAFWLVRLVLVTLKPCGPKLLPSGPNFSQTATATCWSQVGPKYRCSQVGPSWAEVGTLLAEVDPKEPMWRPGRIETVHLAECWADLQNAQSTTAGNRLLANKGPPQLKLYQSDRSVRSHPLLNYHALAPSVRADLYSHAITINYITQNKSALCTCIAWHYIGLHSSQLHYIIYIADVYHCISYYMDIHHIRSEKRTSR